MPDKITETVKLSYNGRKSRNDPYLKYVFMYLQAYLVSCMYHLVYVPLSSSRLSKYSINTVYVFPPFYSVTLSKKCQGQPRIIIKQILWGLSPQLKYKILRSFAVSKKILTSF